MTVTQNDVSTFADYCVYVRSVFMHGRILFEESSEKERDALHGVAPIFFGDLNTILIEYVILQICKITDPAKDNRGKENHTTEFFAKNSDFSSEPAKAQRLEQLHAAMQVFRNKVKPARDKLISHLDRNAILAGSILGVASETEWSKFWQDIQDFVSMLHEKYLGTALYINGVGNISDAHLLLKAVRQSAYFNILVDDPEVSKKCIDLALADSP
ncbi:MAG TPA: hypothetical protein VII91_02475 [Bauldia sp.]